MFGNIGIEENKFCGHVTPIFWGGVDIEKLLLSNKICFGEKNISTLWVTCIMVIKSNH